MNLKVRTLYSFKQKYIPEYTILKHILNYDARLQGIDFRELHDIPSSSNPFSEAIDPLMAQLIELGEEGAEGGIPSEEWGEGRRTASTIKKKLSNNKNL